MSATCAFAEVSAGLAFQGYRFFGPVDEDALHQQLLFTFGYGVYLGRAGPLRGEALLYYDHRKDDHAGGLKAGAGVPGHFGLRGIQDRIEMLGGSFRIDSAPGRGSSLTVTLPAE